MSKVRASAQPSAQYRGDPLRVVALLGQGFAVALDNHGQMELKRFADGSGAGLADEKVRERHVVLHVGSESLDQHWPSRLQGLERRGEFLVVSADHDQLDVGSAPVQVLGDVNHHSRPVAAEKDDAGWTIGIETVTFPLRSAIDYGFFVKARLQYHARSLEDSVIGVSHREGLLPGPLAAGDDELRLRFNPEARWEIRQVSQQSHKWSPVVTSPQAFSQGAVEMWNNRKDQIRRMLSPVCLQQLHDLRMVEANCPLKHPQKLGSETCPTLPEDEVVSVFNLETAQTSGKIDWSKQFLHVQEIDLPGLLLGS